MSSRENTRQLVVLDVDGGVDDAQAIMLALTHPHVQVLGITCVAGNVNVDQVCRNVLRVLKVFDRLEVPVFAGASLSLLGTHVDACHYLGQDGMGDVPDPDPPSADLVQSEHAVSALLRLSREYPGLGNVTPSAEYNFWCDPEAAHVVLEGYVSLFPITVVPWETCVQDHDNVG
ncbi:Hypp2640 [Branchiostoma lanceolatum]|uniref:Hypp2640 protein n=1 Tax=Branchiostoma lanceolatum TaxID=7740 RepID=A0A8J9ZT84_BRALA|nr:Hypp2640 [Branchiostoma lanceolatum]